MLAWVQEAQPNAWETLAKNHGTQAGEVLLARLREQLNTRGILDVLRHGVEMIGLKQKLPLAQFKPALAMNQDILTRYATNRLRIVRQVRYSVHNKNCLDLVLFLNGLPVATVELKTDFNRPLDENANLCVLIDEFLMKQGFKGRWVVVNGLRTPNSVQSDPLAHLPERQCCPLSATCVVLDSWRQRRTGSASQQ